MTAIRALFEAFRGPRAAGRAGVGERVAAVPRMLSMGLRGRYPHLDRSRMALAGLGLLYLLSPVDLVPEAFVWLLGLADDAVVAAWMVGVVLSETDTFLAWERANAPGSHRVVAGEVVE
jgi:uncharacterized membrane protein YkvA (DUF1232 family)